MRSTALYFYLMIFGACGIIHWPETVTSGFEQFSYRGDSLWLEVGGQVYATSGMVDSISFDGEYSLFAPSGGEVVFEYTVPNPRPDGKYLLTVFCRSAGKNNGGAIAATWTDKNGSQRTEWATGAAGFENGWESRELLVQLPPNHGAEEIAFTLVNRGDDPVWFDEFTLEFLDKVYYPEFNNEETVQIRMSEPDLERLKEKRQAAFAAGYLDMDKEDWIRVEVQLDDTVLTGNLTLKGDELKNLEGDKWSMKIELDEGTLLGMQYFSLHSPNLRSFLDEWLFHELLQQEGLVCPKYGFVPITLNGRSLGVYAYEERILDESFVYRDTVNAIARFEDLEWARVLPKRTSGSDHDIPEYAFMEAGIDVFREEAFDKELKKMFKEYLERFRSLDPEIVDVFNKQKSARLLALCDLMEAYHSLHWTNIRFVFEASTGKMELVGNDGFLTSGARRFREGPFMAWTNQKEVLVSERWQAMYLNLFNDSEFLHSYTEALQRYSDKKFMDVTKLNSIGEMKYYQSLLIEEWPAYRFNYSRLYSRARKIQQQVNSFRQFADSTALQYRFVE